MKINWILCLLTSTVGCSLFSCNKIKKSDAEIERENWIASFNDSISYYKNEISNLETRFAEANSFTSGLLDNFEYISNPRQVAGYYILKGWNDKIPLKTTGIYARINEDEKLELLATLSGGNFNQISISNGSQEVNSNVVPHDQALNYRHNNLNTVCFYGSAADSVAEMIADNVTDKLTLNFIEGDKKKQAVIPDDEKNMIAQTWELYSYKVEITELQKKMWLYSKKIDAYRRMMENKDSISNKTSNI